MRFHDPWGRHQCTRWAHPRAGGDISQRVAGGGWPGNCDRVWQRTSSYEQLISAGQEALPSSAGVSHGQTSKVAVRIYMQVRRRIHKDTGHALTTTSCYRRQQKVTTKMRYTGCMKRFTI